MPWTPLHAALGDIGSTLDFSLIQRAVDEGIEENSNLDWKSVPPLTATDAAGRQAQGIELAKDIAALANSGGGMIVYGVQEQDGDTSAAGLIKTFKSFGETDLRNIRQVANNLIYPPVTGLDLMFLTAEGNSDEGVLVALISPSADSPHLLYQKGNHEWFQAPWRDGSNTRRMAERQLADAYRQREQRRQRQEQDFAKIYSDTVKSVGGTNPGIGPTWIIGVAVPLQPRLDERRLNAISARRFLHASHQYFKQKGFSPLSELLENDTRVGLRKFIFASSRTSGPGKIQARIELHGNGSFALAFTRDGVFGQNIREVGQVPVDDLLAMAKDIIALILQSVDSGSISSDYMVKAGVEPHTEIFRHPDPSLPNHYQPFDERHRVKNHEPVQAVMVTRYGREQLLESAAEFVTDLMMQIGSWVQVTASQLEHEIRMNEDY